MYFRIIQISNLFDIIVIQMKLDVEVIGSKPPCSRCKKLHENVEDAVNALVELEINVAISHRDASTKEVIQEYGACVSLLYSPIDVTFKFPTTVNCIAYVA